MGELSAQKRTKRATQSWRQHSNNTLAERGAYNLNEVDYHLASRMHNMQCDATQCSLDWIVPITPNCTLARGKYHLRSSYTVACKYNFHVRVTIEYAWIQSANIHTINSITPQTSKIDFVLFARHRGDQTALEITLHECYGLYITGVFFSDVLFSVCHHRE